MCKLLVGLPDINVVAVDDRPGDPIRVVVESRLEAAWCPGCGCRATVKDRPTVALVDLPCFGRPAELVWRKHRWRCPQSGCPAGSWTHADARIAPSRAAMTDRAARWATIQVGRLGRSVNEVAGELGCDWHTINDAVIRYGHALLDADVDRIGEVHALGLDETLFCRAGRWRSQQWCTSIVDVGPGARLLDVVAGRNATAPAAWIDAQPQAWRAGVRYGVLDLSGPYRKVFTDALAHAIQVADPFHLVKVRHEAPCVRGRVRDPPFRAVAAGR